MTTVSELQSRSDSKCELCTSTENLNVYEVPPSSNGSADECLLICGTCQQQIDNPDNKDVHHWHCLKESMWNQTPAVQVIAWRILTRLNNESWAQDLLEMLYLEDDNLAWAQATNEDRHQEETLKHLDSHGVLLTSGDTVTLIKDLNVKGAGFTAKRGTAVRSISLVTDNAQQIEGRVNGQQIVILTQFVKKSG